MKITFLGATQEVTGSRYLIEHDNTKILVDCGLFQGEEEISSRNWDPFPIEPSRIDAVLLTHAHIDHSGYVPLLVKNGFKGKIYSSRATFALCSILLVDSATIFEENAKRANEYKNADEPIAMPLYTKTDAERSLQFFQVVDYDKVLDTGALKITFISSGHIPGASFVTISDGKQTLTFSGDLGRPDQLIMKAPPHVKQTDFLVLDSTYGDRVHEQGDSIQILGGLVNKTVAKGGKLIIPAFAVGRSQMILYCLYQLRQKNVIPKIPIFLDSPMAIRINELFCNFHEEYRISSTLCKDMIQIATSTPTVEESKHINEINQPVIVVVGSGMADGGRVLHHFKQVIKDPKNTIAFVGYQAQGSIGRTLVDGAQEINIFGRSYHVEADIEIIRTFSAHADYNEILQWLGYFEGIPKKVFLTHGDKESAQSLQQKIEERFGWNAVVPAYLESFDLD